jgi:hypothetical protein
LVVAQNEPFVWFRWHYPLLFTNTATDLLFSFDTMICDFCFHRPDQNKKSCTNCEDVVYCVGQ